MRMEPGWSSSCARGIGAGTRRPHHRIERRAGGGGAPRRALDGKALRRQPPARAGEDAGARRMKRPAGLQTIIVYKLAKSVVQALLGVGSIWLLARGAEAGAATLAEFLLEHFTGAWALQVATVLVRATTAGRVKLLAFAMIGDSILSGVEGLALRAGRRWAPWLGVMAA